MQILVVGAGAIGGYFGGRLLQAHRDVTFLVRERRTAQLRSSGLTIRSVKGDFHDPAPPTVSTGDLRQAYDLILLSCKAYDLNEAIESFAPAVGPRTAILPLLNGLRHLDVLEARFGRDVVLGGQCVISAALNAEGAVLHLNDSHSLTFGDRSGEQTERARAILSEFAGAQFQARLSDSILLEMWEKWVFIAAAAGITCLMRSAIGDVIAAGGAGLAAALLDECAAIASNAGYAPRAKPMQRSRAALCLAGSPMMASMLRDIERGSRTEVEQILGDLLRRQEPGADSASLLRLAHIHVTAYEARRTRESSEK